MNQNVYGSSFVETKRSNLTEKMINSELIVPASAVEMTYEEINEIDGKGLVGWGVEIIISERLAKTLIGAGVAGIVTAITASSVGLAAGFGVAAGYIAEEFLKEIIKGNVSLYQTIVAIWIPFVKTDITYTPIDISGFFE